LLSTDETHTRSALLEHANILDLARQLLALLHQKITQALLFFFLTMIILGPDRNSLPFGHLLDVASVLGDRRDLELSPVFLLLFCCRFHVGEQFWGACLVLTSDIPLLLNILREHSLDVGRAVVAKVILVIAG